MARYRRYRRTIIRAPKKKWASNIRLVTLVSGGDTSLQYATTELVNNSSELATPTPVIIKTGNIKVQGDFRIVTTSSGGNVGVSLYVIFVPQGITIENATGAENLINNHPEWIMAWKYLGSNTTIGTGVENGDSFSFSSRLKRNLNSGDSIQLICLVRGVNISQAAINGMAQYWTCAN